MNDCPQTPHPWELDLTDAKEAMIVAMRDAASTPEEVEVYVSVGVLIRSGHVDELISWRKREHQRALRKARLAQARAKKVAAKFSRAKSARKEAP